jgi:lysophospholipase L1-like esterase
MTPLRILCFGDSLTQGYHGFGYGEDPYSETLEAKLREAFPGREIKVVTSGVPGDMVCTSRFITRMNQEGKSLSLVEPLQYRLKTAVLEGEQ